MCYMCYMCYMFMFRFCPMVRAVALKIPPQLVGTWLGVRHGQGCCKIEDSGRRFFLNAWRRFVFQRAGSQDCISFVADPLVALFFLVVRGVSPRTTCSSFYIFNTASRFVWL